MIKKEKLCIIAGDRRLRSVKNLLEKDGYECECENEDVNNAVKLIRESRYIILPSPFSRDNIKVFSDNDSFSLYIDSFFEALSSDKIVLGGGFSKKNIDEFDKKHIVYIDINKNEDFVLFNSFLTAQGALALLLENTQKLITGAEVLVTGFGKCGKAVSDILDSVKMKVTVGARNTLQLTEALGRGYNIVNIRNNFEICRYDYIFNTVPENIFGISQLSGMKEDSVYFELASAPFGANKNDFSGIKARYIDAGGIPGKFVFESAAFKMAEFIKKFL